MHALIGLEACFMSLCKYGCDNGCEYVKMFCFSRANHASTNLKKFLSQKLDKFTLWSIWNNSFLNCGGRWKWRMIIAVNFPI